MTRAPARRYGSIGLMSPLGTRVFDDVAASMREVSAEVIARADPLGAVGAADERRGWTPRVTAGPALAGLVTVPEPEETVRRRWGHLLADIPPGDIYLHYTAERGYPDPVFEWRSGYWSFLLKLSSEGPSPTIHAQPGPNVGLFHWEDRRCRVPELRRRFTFPDDFTFAGRRSSMQAQVDNAVPRYLPARLPIASLKPSASTEMPGHWNTSFPPSEVV